MPRGAYERFGTPPMGTALSAELSWRGNGCREVPGALSRLTGRGNAGFFYMGREGSSRRSRSAHLESRGRCGDGYPTSDGPSTVVPGCRHEWV